LCASHRELTGFCLPEHLKPHPALPIYKVNEIPVVLVDALPHLLHRPVHGEIRTQDVSSSGQAAVDAISNLPICFPVNSEQSPLVSPAAASQLTTLLAQTAIDLGEISDAIRACPEFELVVLRMSETLALSLGARVASIEEAVVILGKDHLNVLVQTWSGSRSSEPVPKIF
jgi:hypothetical protein